MKNTLLALMILTAATLALGQQSGTPAGDQMASYAATYCKAPWAPNSPERMRMAAVVSKLRPVLNRDFFGHRIAYIAVQSPIVNAWEIDNTGNSPIQVICVPTAMIDLMSSEGELAFILGHETGHAVDDGCARAKSKNNTLALDRSCELRADSLGFKFMTEMGYSAYDAGGAFGKLEMYSGDVATGPAAQVRALGKNHPMTAARILNMRNLLAQYQARSK